MKISVITPSYNQGQFLEETILSVINQNYPNLEYFIIDGGSTDNSIEIIKKYEKHLTYWVSEKDNGQSEAINKGFRKATGDIVCWINSDDILIENALSKVGAFFYQNPSIEMLVGDIIHLDKHSNIIRPFYSLKPQRAYALRGVYYIAQQGMFWRKNIFNKIGGLINEEYHMCMDKELLNRCFDHKIKFARINAFLGGFRIYSEAKTGKMNITWAQEILKIQNEFPNYKIKADAIGLIHYRLEKFVRGFYLSQYLFQYKFKGKS